MTFQEYLEKFKKMNDKQLIDSFNNEIDNPGWTSSRANYLTSLHKEFNNRGYDYFEIGDDSKLSLKNKIYLLGKKIKILTKKDK